MSRPFSYNDENFTVNGNVLYIHIKYEEAAKAETRLIEIPPAIYDRLLFFSNVCIAAYRHIDANAGNLVMTIINYNNKHYLAPKTNINSGEGRYIFGTFMLKDI